MKYVAVIDIGKTNAKLVIVDLTSLNEVALRKTPNIVLNDGLYPHADVDALWSFILESLKALNRDFKIDAITVTTHGATAALVNDHGKLILPILDYEFDGPDELEDGYNSIRPDFSETGSPRLPMGLNLGAQIYWQQQKFPVAFSLATRMLLYPQYWSFRLSGVAAAEITSLGCHTDLWSPRTATYSSLVKNRNWSSLMQPLCMASDVLGPLLPEIAKLTKLDPNTPIYCGIHDSNASLVPHLIQRKTPCSVISTGTWVIAMALGNKVPSLDPRRDTLLNVSAFGKPVPSARFMGGREYQIIMEGQTLEAREEDVLDVLSTGSMLLPSVVGGSGPFPDQTFRWVKGEELTPAKRQIVVSFYLAMMMASCLALIGAEGDIIVEGPLTANNLMLDMLSAATNRNVLLGSVASTGTTIGAALLVAKKAPEPARVHHTNPELVNLLEAYGAIWRKLVSYAA